MMLNRKIYFLNNIFFRSLFFIVLTLEYMDTDYKNFRRLNNITGWIVFAISAWVYLLTLEPTVSFWDCGEFILSAFKLQVGHPPGAPTFLLMGRIFTLFAGSDASKAAVMVNTMSALASAFTILFLFWTITHLIRKVMTRGAEFIKSNNLIIIGSGVIGALAYTFSDTFWFSAVEGEVYGTSSLFTAVVFWAILKWEDEAEEPDSGRWIILIAYLMGLSIGVHLLNLLAIPALVLVFYFKKYEVTTRGIIRTLLISLILLGAFVFFVISGTAKIAGWFELFLVNTLGLPYDSGLFLYLILLIALIIWGVRFSIKNKKIILNYVITAFAVILIGYSSFAMIMIRASAKPPMDQNAPSDVFSFLYYINREQYGSAPLVYGNYFQGPVIDSKDVVAGYNKENGEYTPFYKSDYTYDKQFMTIFPRMYSRDPEHETAYNFWGKIIGKKISFNTGSGSQTFTLPTFSENLRFFFRYQVGYMYLRYFMWNFAGRQNDVQGNGNDLQGNWISGIKFIDEARLGKQYLMPADIVNNPAHNTYYFLPLLAGIAGMFWQYKRDKKDFWVVLSFFIMTGLAIVVYLNQNPNQPRERDYAYAGSFYVFAIWIGMGTMLLFEKLKRFIQSRYASVVAFIVLLFAVPVLYATQNWDDHDRSGRYTARDIGANYLNSVAQNGIIFTYGDNDSFPLWYVQDVEGIRTDVRVANLSYLQAGWYIEMMRQKAYESDALPFTLGTDKYVEGKRNQMIINNQLGKPVEIEKVVEFAGLDDKRAMIDYSGNGDYINYFPTNKFLIAVDTAKVLANGTVKEYYKDRIESPIIWDFTGTEAFKNDLAIMDLFASSKWYRPIYFSTTVPSSQYKGLEKYFVQEGLAYRVVPIKIDSAMQGNFGMIDTRTMYDNMMNKFKWGNASDPKVYLDENNRRMFSNYRRIFGDLAMALISEGDTSKAIAASYRGLEIVPESKMPNDYFSILLAEVLIKAGEKEEGEQLLNKIVSYSKGYLEHAISLPPDKRFGLDYTTAISMQSFFDIYNLAVKYNLDALLKSVETDLNRYYAALYSGK